MVWKLSKISFVESDVIPYLFVQCFKFNIFNTHINDFSLLFKAYLVKWKTSLSITLNFGEIG